MVIWQGFGIVVLVVIGVLAFGAEYLTATLFGASFYTQYEDYVAGGTYLLGAPILWFVGRYLNGGKTQVLVDQATGEEVILRPNHSLFFIKVEYWAIIVFVLACWSFLSSVL